MGSEEWEPIGGLLRAKSTGKRTKPRLIRRDITYSKDTEAQKLGERGKRTMQELELIGGHTSSSFEN